MRFAMITSIRVVRAGSRHNASIGCELRALESLSQRRVAQRACRQPQEPAVAGVRGSGKVSRIM